MRKGEWIQTYSGREFWLLDPRPEDFHVEDIAHALALKCRYNGHCKDFYSVAQHSVYVANECKRRHPDNENLVKWGLLHDLEEAYLPDIPRPIKRMGTGVLGESAALIMEAASIRFKLEGTSEPDEVKAADTAVLAAEKEQLIKPNLNGNGWALPEPPAPIRIKPMGAMESKSLFLDYFNNLFG